MIPCKTFINCNGHQNHPRPRPRPHPHSHHPRGTRSSLVAPLFFIRDHHPPQSTNHQPPFIFIRDGEEARDTKFHQDLSVTFTSNLQRFQNIFGKSYPSSNMFGSSHAIYHSSCRLTSLQQEDQQKLFSKWIHPMLCSSYVV